jgi:hypothetical protein
VPKPKRSFPLGLSNVDPGLWHGQTRCAWGYFEGEFSRQLLYRLAFLGFGDYLTTLNAEPHTALSQLHLTCREKQIQCFLSPFRYRVSIQNGSLQGTKQEMLEAIEVEDVEKLKQMGADATQP